MYIDNFDDGAEFMFVLLLETVCVNILKHSVKIISLFISNTYSAYTQYWNAEDIQVCYKP